MPAARRGVFFLTFLAVLLAFSIHSIFAQGDGSSPLEISVTYRASSGETNPVSVAGKDISAVTIDVLAREDVCQDVINAYPIDVILVIDVSGSMDEATSDGISKLNATKQAGSAFIAQLTPNDRVGVVGFSNGAFTAIGLTRDFVAAQEAVNGLTLGGGTNIASGIDEASSILGGPDQAPVGTTIPVIIVLSDGQDNASTVNNAAARARTILEEVKIASIGLGTGVDTGLLEGIADPGLAFFTADSAQLLTIYESLVTLVQPRVNATNLTIGYRYDRANYELQPASISPPPNTISGDTITWTLPSLNEGDSATYSFEVRSTSPGMGSVGQAFVEYIPCEESNLRTEAVDGPTINTILPSVTPLPTATAVPSLTPTPLPTGTPLPPNALSQGPIGDIENPEVNSDFCTENDYDWIAIAIAALVLLIILLLIIGLLLHRVNRDPKMTTRDWLCAALRALAAVYFAFLLFIFLPPIFTNQFCAMPDSVYFRRMDTDTSGIFLTHPEFDGEQVPQVSTLNQTGCVGCHVTNDVSNRVAAVIGPPPGRIVIIDKDGNRLDKSLVAAVYLSFSPDGRQLAYSDQNSDIYILDIETGQIRPVPGASDPNVAEVMPSWHPLDSSIIAFVRADLGNAHELGLFVDNRSDIYLVDMDSSQPPTPVVGASLNGLNYYPSFSPDGEYLLFTHSPEGRSYNNTEADIWLVPYLSGQAVRVSANANDASDAWAVWSRDGASIVFQSNRDDDNYDIFIADVVEDGNLLDARNPQPLAGASTSGVYEYTAVFGEPITRIGILEELNPLLYLLGPLVGLLILSLLCWIIPCVETDSFDDEEEQEPRPAPIVSTPQDIVVKRELQVLWEPQPTLIIGLGAAGRWVLTHLKKTLLDATLDNQPEHVVLLAIDTAGYGNDEQYAGRTNIAFAGVKIEHEELLLWRDSLNGIIQDTTHDEALAGWLNAEYIENIGMTNFDPASGFSDQRVLGRLALIQNLRGESRETGVDLWERLKKAAQNANNDGNLTVMLVADISDDVGSGSIIDLAHLIRQLQPELDLMGVQIVAHLVTEHAQRDVQGNHRVLTRRQVNSIAALRELRRFGVASASTPMPIVYGRDKQHPRDGMISHNLFDELYLYDGGIRNAPLNQAMPQYGIYPAIADSIAVWMDKAASNGNLQVTRSNQIAASGQTQRSISELAVSSIGIYQYRLPFNDILRAITAQYARTVLQWLLVAQEGEPNLIFRETKDPLFRAGPTSNSQPMSSQRIALLFLAEEYGSPERLGNRWRHLLQALFGEKEGRDLKRVASSFRKHKDEDLRELMIWTRQFVLLILNGSQYQENEEDPVPDTAKFDYVALRGAKLALAKSVLESLCGIDGRDGLLQQRANELRALTQSEDNAAAQALNAWANQIYTLYKQLMDTARWIGASSEANSLYSQLGIWQNQIIESEAELNQLVTRKHIWRDKNETQYKSFAEAWYQQYMHDNVLRGLATLHWGLNEADEIQLQMRMPIIEDQDEEPELICLNLELNDSAKATLQIREFAQRFIELARFFAADIPRQQNLANILSTDILDPYSLAQTSQTLRNNAAIALQYDKGTSEVEGLIVSANMNVDTNTLEKHLKQASARPDMLTILQTTDPYTLTFIKTVDAVAISQVGSINTAHTVYLQEVGIIQEQDEGILRPTEIFAVEHEALYYERKLHLVRERARLLTPLVTALLVHPVEVRVFLLALASSQDAVLDKAGAISYQKVVFNRDGAISFQNIELVSRADGRLLPSPILTALLRFIERVDNTTVKVFEQRYSGEDGRGTNDEDLLDAWEAFYRSKFNEWLALNEEHQTRLDRDILKDLVAMTRILVKLQLG